jgi:hypothetical protein
LKLVNTGNDEVIWRIMQKCVGYKNTTKNLKKKIRKKNPKSWNSGLNLCQGETIERLDYSIYSPIGKSNHGRVCIE